jgi:hypothetical protein
MLLDLFNSVHNDDIEPIGENGHYAREASTGEKLHRINWKRHNERHLQDIRNNIARRKAREQAAAMKAKEDATKIPGGIIEIPLQDLSYAPQPQIGA